MKHEHRIPFLSAVGPLPAVAAALAFLWLSSWSIELRISLTSLILVFWLVSLASVHQRLVFPLRTVANMLGALRERDFSMPFSPYQTEPWRFGPIRGPLLTLKARF